MYKIIFSFFLLLPLFSWAKRNSDPSWEEMIRSSDFIVRVQITKGGDFEAKAKRIKTYKGEDLKEFSIKGYSDKSAKMNYLKSGDKYIMFLKKTENPEVFKVWSPTAGFHKMQKSYVQYDLLQTTKYLTQEFYALDEFETFLDVAIHQDKDNSKFFNEHLELIGKKSLAPICAQYVMMLQIAGHEEYHPDFLEIMHNKEIDCRVALARYLGAVHNDESRMSLVTLLNDRDEIVAEEAANQLIHFDKELAGKALLRKLTDQNPPSLLSENGSISSFKLKLVKSLVAIDYKPTVDVLAPMLSTTNKYLFNLVLQAIGDLHGKGYLPELEKHFANKDTEMYHTIFEHVCTNKLENGEKLIAQFLNEHDKSGTEDYSYLVSSKYAGKFYSEQTTSFLIDNFKKLSKSQLDVSVKNSWAVNHFDYFSTFEVEHVKQDMYSICGDLLNVDFAAIQSDTVFNVDSNLIDIENDFSLGLFSQYLTKVGNVEDLVFLHKLEAQLNIDSAKRREVVGLIAKLEEKINANKEQQD